MSGDFSWIKGIGSCTHNIGHGAGACPGKNRLHKKIPGAGPGIFMDFLYLFVVDVVGDAVVVAVEELVVGIVEDFGGAHTAG